MIIYVTVFSWITKAKVLPITHLYDTGHLHNLNAFKTEAEPVPSQNWLLGILLNKPWLQN